MGFSLGRGARLGTGAIWDERRLSTFIGSTLTTGATALAILSGHMAVSPQATQSDEAHEAHEAIERVAPEVIDASIGFQPHKDHFSAASGDIEVVAPSTTDNPVHLTADTFDILSIGLPTSNAEVVSVDDGVIAYEETEGVSVLVSAQEDASVMIATVLHDAQAADRFEYRYAGVELVLTNGGDVLGHDENGALVLTVALPWALDADGRDVPTRYEVNGDTLTQIVEHTDSEFTYPIVADPLSYGGNFMYSKIVHDSDSRGDIIRVYPKSIKFANYSNDAIWANYRAVVPSVWERDNMKDQLLCHVWNVALLKSPWNLEPWRPDRSYNATVLAGCNPQ